MFGQKTNSNHQQDGSASLMETLFSDINIDCQERIFEYLNLVDLLNIADSSKQFKTAANLVFARKYENELVNVGLFQPQRNQNQPTQEEIGRILYAKTCLQLIRNFGHRITALKLEPIKDTSQEDLFSSVFKCAINYIKEYCTELLTEIHIRQCPEGYYKYLKPLQNVQTVEIDSFGFEGLSKDTLNILFPKLHRLVYIDFDQSLGMIENHFPHLEQLGVRRGRGSNITPWDNVSLNVFELNPQLRRLDYFDIGSDANVLRSIENLQYLEMLYLMWDTKYATVANNFNGETFHFPTVKTFKIFFMNSDGEYISMPAIPFTFSQLEQCSISLKTSSLNKLYRFFDRSPTILKLKLSLNVNFLDLQKIANVLPSLVEFKVDSNAVFLKEDVIEFVDALPSLKKACIATFFDSDFEELKELLGNRWHTSFDNKTVTLERF